MISVERIMKTTPQRVWDVLSDGWLYPLWVVGASRMREVDDSWPAVGSKLHHSVGVWPALLDDNTEVTDCEPLRMLALRARAWPFGEAAVVAAPQRVRRRDPRRDRGGRGLRTGQAGPQAGPGTGSEVAQRRDACVGWPTSPSDERDRAPGSRAPVTSYDAVVIGAGPNGLVAANHLVDAGWSVLVLEAQPDLGGAVRSANDVHPEFVHDTFSAFYPLAAASPTIKSFHLEDHGLVWRHAPAVLGHPLPDGQWALLDRDRELTASWFEDQQPGDGEAWLDLCRDWDVMGEHLIAGLLTPFPPVRAGLAGLLNLRRAGGLQFVRTLLTPAADLGRNRFRGEAPRVAARRQRRPRRHPPRLPWLGPDGTDDEHDGTDRRVPGPGGRRR